MSQIHTRAALENRLWQSIGNEKRLTLGDFSTWLLHRAHRPDEFGQDTADAAAAAWRLLVEYKQEHGV